MKTLVIALLLTTSIAHADEMADTAQSATYSLDIGSHIRWFGDTSAAIVSTDPLAGVRLTLGRSLTTTQLRKRDVELGVFARYVYAGASGTMFGDLDTSMSQHMLGGGARADAPLTHWLVLNAQAELGMTRTSLEVTHDEMTPVDDAHWAPYTAGSLGAEIRVSTGRLDISIGLDLGYVLTMPVELHALPGDRPAEDLSITTAFSGIGKIDTRGFVYAMSLRGRF